MPSAWLLNLDADLELAAPRGYQPTADVERRMAALRARVRADLFESGDIEIEAGSRLQAADRGLAGRAWCMTARARKLLLAAGAQPIDSPSVEVLQRVNARSFAFELNGDKDPAICSSAPQALADFLDRAPTGSEWLAKRAHGMAGRGQRRLRAGTQSAADRHWLVRACASGSVLVEPRRQLDLECTWHGELSRTGELYLGPVLGQRCDAQGAWIANIPDPPITTDEGDLLLDAAKRCAFALREAGYFGPFGLDAYAWIEDGERRWNTISDLNARYTMGWTRSPCMRLQAPET